MWPAVIGGMARVMCYKIWRKPARSMASKWVSTYRPGIKTAPVYGTDGYNEYFMKQLTEVLTNYGDIFEVWFDGAVGPEYKGKQPYDWGGFIATVREHQPDAVIFSDAGPDIRWVGTEKGFANPTQLGDSEPRRLLPRYPPLRRATVGQ